MEDEPDQFRVALKDVMDKISKEMVCGNKVQLEAIYKVLELEKKERAESMIDFNALLRDFKSDPKLVL